ncbi:MAG TPA: hypothetical protein VFH27_11580 [Longimicrobiaceae bacterium]|nr:hypothetical protein [Longimicrobiaceae bacterium]
MPIQRFLLVPIAVLALALAACDRGDTPAQEQAAKDSAASVAPAEAVPPASSSTPTDSTAAVAPAPGDAPASTALPADHGNAAAYASCMQKASRARSADERSVLEGTCAASRPR